MKIFSLNTNLLKTFFILTLLLCIYIFICAKSYACTVSTNISTSVLRLHVLANSNSQEDQNLKLKVRDAIIEYTNTLIHNSMKKEDVISTMNEHIDTLYAIAKNVIHENGYDYDVHILIGNFLFPTKEYGDISLPAGYYDGIRIEIGKAQGNNWWCVMFPPLCFVDVTTGIVPDESKEIMQENMSNEEYNLISNDSLDMQFKFKIVELFNTSPLLTAFN